MTSLLVLLLLITNLRILLFTIRPLFPNDFYSKASVPFLFKTNLLENVNEKMHFSQLYFNR